MKGKSSCMKPLIFFLSKSHNLVPSFVLSPKEDKVTKLQTLPPPPKNIFFFFLAMSFQVFNLHISTGLPTHI